VGKLRYGWKALTASILHDHALAPHYAALASLAGDVNFFGMTTVEDIEKAVEQLDPRELVRFRAWFEAFDAEQFDTAIERDARAGKLDALADEAVAVYRAECKDGEYECAPEELAGIDRGLRDAAESRFASDRQVETVFAKFRDK
jgi:hypothetical protein